MKNYQFGLQRLFLLKSFTQRDYDDFYSFTSQTNLLDACSEAYSDAYSEVLHIGGLVRALLNNFQKCYF